MLPVPLARPCPPFLVQPHVTCPALPEGGIPVLLATTPPSTPYPLLFHPAVGGTLQRLWRDAGSLLCQGWRAMVRANPVAAAGRHRDGQPSLTSAGHQGVCHGERGQGVYTTLLGLPRARAAPLLAHGRAHGEHPERWYGEAERNSNLYLEITSHASQCPHISLLQFTTRR